ncbi:hypothetical protein [Ferroacidibacillus organovorans]|uniref:hypothetical protein n=1 Tax=Ferroacidibacillus organovorans TaxID=1765683 RepID=UPI0015C4652E|nr:hypothetical protein [Ferroacidibacillus organovorans]
MKKHLYVSMSHDLEKELLAIWRQDYADFTLAQFIAKLVEIGLSQEKIHLSQV